MVKCMPTMDEILHTVFVNAICVNLKVYAAQNLKLKQCY